MLKTFDKQKNIQNKIKCELCLYNIKNLTIKYIVILGKFFKKLFLCKTLTILTLKCTSHIFGKISITSKQ